MQLTREQQPALTLFAVGMIGLGVLGLIYGDFAMVWQPVASWVPGRTALAYLAAAVMLVGGAGCCSRRRCGGRCGCCLSIALCGRC